MEGDTLLWKRHYRNLGKADAALLYRPFLREGRGRSVFQRGRRRQRLYLLNRRLEFW